MLIGKHNVGANYRPLIIAELGINHEGNLSLAKKLAELAAESGADIIKTQMHIPNEEMSKKAKEIIPDHCTKSIYEIMENCSLNIDEEYKLKEFIEGLDCEYLCTPFSVKAAEILGNQFKVNAFKIGSGECNNFHILKKVSEYQKPVIVSTGMNDLSACRTAYEYLHKENNCQVVLMHTTNLYPTPPNLVRYGGLQALQKHFPDLVVGLSDHTLNNYACLGAVALGASILERHFTDHMNRQGPDIICSMDEAECATLISGSKEVALMRGGTKEPAKEEQVTIDFAFATVCTIKQIRRGEILSKENIWVKRPGTGPILAAEFYDLLGKKATRDLPLDYHLDHKDFE